MTAAEKDTESDEDRRMLMPRRRQDALLDSNAATQSSILDTLPAHIALLDPQGIIVSVNQAWREFASANELQNPGAGIGLNYLDVCDGARGNDAADAHKVAAGIRSVLSGSVKNFSTEYSCHSPTQQRWFRMTATPLENCGSKGVVVMHLSVTAEWLAEERLRASELQFRQMAGNIRDVVFLVETDSNRFLYVSPAYENIFARSCASLYANWESWSDAVHPDDLASTCEKCQRGKSTGTFEFECRILRPDGSIRWIETRGFPVLDDAGTLVRIAGITADITERRQAETRIAYLNRVQAVLSGISALIVRVRDRDELFREACRIAVQTGGFGLAWIGILDQNSMKITLTVSAGGTTDLVAAIDKRLSASKSAAPGNTLVTLAIRSRKIVVSNDVQNDPGVELSRQYAESGICSMAILPLVVSNEVAGLMMLYASEIEFFHEEEMKLLTVLAVDVGHAMDLIDKQQRLDHLAYYDQLTGLANRSLFLERLAQRLRSAVSGGHKLAVFVMDVQHFKNINDSFGRPAGDELLRQVAEWLTRDACGDASRFARVGADQFAGVRPETRQESDIVQSLDTSLEAFLDYPFRLNDAVFRIGARIGIAMFPDDGIDPDALVRHAEDALKQAKASGDRYLFYTEAAAVAVSGRLTLEYQLRQALALGEFVLHYQPKVNSASGRLTGAEALLRWNDPRTGLVLPGRFITILEETGLIHDVGRWALHTAIADCQRWRGMGLATVPIAVNVSPLQLRHRGFISEIQEVISIHPQAAAGLELEITEGQIMQDVKHSIASLRAIRAMGVSVAVDDFGTGFSSLSYLSRLPLDTLKIDRSFVTGMMTGPEGKALISTIIKLGHALKLKVVAEGVETEAQAQLLRLLDCDEMQGFFISRAVPAEIFELRYLLPIAEGSVGLPPSDRAPETR